MSAKRQKHYTSPLEKKYAADRPTLLAIQAKQAFRKREHKKFTEFVDKLTSVMDLKFKRILANLDKGRVRSPIDPKNHLINLDLTQRYADDLRDGDCLTIMENVIHGYRPSIGPFIPYADKAIYFYFLKAFKEYLYMEDFRCVPLRNGDVSKNKFFKKRMFLSETSVQRKLEEAFDLLPDQRRRICIHYYLGFLKTSAIAKKLEISQSTVRVAKKKALEMLRTTSPEIYRICKEFDKL